MRPNDEQLKFLKKRQVLMKAWRWVGPGCVLAVLGFGLWLSWKSPLLVNPLEVLSRIENGTLENGTLEMLAGMLPLMFMACLGLLLTLVLLMYAAFANERRYLEIITSEDISKEAASNEP